MNDHILEAAVSAALKPKPRKAAKAVTTGVHTMADVIQLTPKDQWQFTVEVMKKPDGSFIAVLSDARGTLIEGPAEPSEKLEAIAGMLEMSVAGMRGMAQAIKTARRSGGAA